jgi:hypothetical protein
VNVSLVQQLEVIGSAAATAELNGRPTILLAVF